MLRYVRGQPKRSTTRWYSKSYIVFFYQCSESFRIKLPYRINCYWPEVKLVNELFLWSEEGWEQAPGDDLKTHVWSYLCTCLYLAWNPMKLPELAEISDAVVLRCSLLLSFRDSVVRPTRHLHHNTQQIIRLNRDSSLFGSWENSDYPPNSSTITTNAQRTASSIPIWYGTGTIQDRKAQKRGTDTTLSRIPSTHCSLCCRSAGASAAWKQGQPD